MTTPQPAQEPHDDQAGTYRPDTVERLLDACQHSLTQERLGRPPIPIVPTVALFADIAERLLRLEQIIRDHA